MAVEFLIKRVEAETKKEARRYVAEYQGHAVDHSAYTSYEANARPNWKAIHIERTKEYDDFGKRVDRLAEEIESNREKAKKSVKNAVEDSQ